jgi:hypothetical protein
MSDPLHGHFAEAESFRARPRTRGAWANRPEWAAHDEFSVERLMGRPTKISRPVAERIVAATKCGATREAAAAAGPVARSTLYAWLRRGRLNPDSPEGAFVARIDAADDEAERQCIDLWRGHFEKDWRAIAEFMARRWPQRWARQRSSDAIGPDGHGVALTVDERARALCERAAEYQAAREARR